ADVLHTTPEFPLQDPAEPAEQRVVYKYEKEKPPFPITRGSDGAFSRSGDKIEKRLQMTDFSREESVRRFARQLRAMGVDDALRERGAQDGDTVRLLDYEFEFVDDWDER
ncbi:Obg family GTPase CgtA, partial [Geobacillus stearothermophilus]|uniref:Obg family GTPase CgtA n=1 Tax=Geobacillus stearothermophilus TaxID=1422 RepID=UPI002E1BB535|nr:Obg family GTPase CgtA [Geobacillus stearothermophilus]